MKLYIVKGVSPTVPGQPQFVSSDQAKAGEFAADLVTALAIDNHTPPWTNPVTSENWRDKLVDVQAWLWACEHGSSVTHGRNWVKEAVALGRDPGEELRADVWIEEHDVDVPLIPVKVWIASADAKDGTQGDVFTSERAAIEWIVDQLDKHATMEAFDDFDGGDLFDFIEANRKNSFDTFNLDSKELMLPVPGIGPRPRVVVSVEGGLITGASSDVPVDLCTVDYDVEGVDEADIVALPQSGTGDTADAYLRGAYVNLDPEWTEVVFAMEAGEHEAAIAEFGTAVALERAMSFNVESTPGVDPVPMTGRDVLEIFKPLPPEEIAALRSVGAPGFENDAEAAVDAAIKAAIADGEVGCGQCEGTGTIEGGLGGDGEDEACPVCDGPGDLPSPEVGENDPAAIIAAGLDLLDNVPWAVPLDANNLRFLALHSETDETRVYRVHIIRES